jgi:RNA polymerase sigma-70 factor
VGGGHKQVEIPTNSSAIDAQSPAFIALLTQAQPSLRGYARSLLADASAANDVVQEASVTIWKKAADFDENTSFMAWACRIVYFHVLSHRRKMARDRLVFDDDVLDYIAERQIDRVEQYNDREAALKACLESLKPEQRALIEERYAPRCADRADNAAPTAGSRRHRCGLPKAGPLFGGAT